jgi:serine/threonine-protein kinase
MTYEAGQLIAGKYRVEQALGQGGMGVVVAAFHEQLKQRVALKFLTEQRHQQPDAVTRFVREARAAAQIQSEHVVRVMDVGTLEDGSPYMVMEYLSGRDLDRVCMQRGQLPVSEAVDYVLQACDAVAEAHSLGIVHRDLKPANLFLTKRADGSPLVKVLDFGVSKALHRVENDAQHMTSSTAMMGSPQYMSPEQIRSSKHVDARSDIWALGAILHQLLAGKAPFSADTMPSLLARIVTEPPAPLSTLNTAVPSEIEAIVLRCLEKERERRFASVAQLVRALEPFASAETRPLARRIGASSGVAPFDRAASDRRVSSSERARRPVSALEKQAPPTRSALELEEIPFHRRSDVRVAAAIGVLGVGALIWLLMTPPSSRPEAEQPPDVSTLVPTQPAKPAPPSWDAPVAAPVQGQDPQPPVRPADVDDLQPSSQRAGPDRAVLLRKLAGAPPRGSRAKNKSAAGSAGSSGDPLQLFDDTK